MEKVQSHNVTSSSKYHTYVT